MHASPISPPVEFSSATETETTDALSNWQKLVKQYHGADVRRSTWQLINSIGPYLALLAAMYFTLGVSYWLTLLLAIPAAGFLVRIFIIMHDCGHQSFFKSQRANDFWGIVTGLLTFTPYYHWRHQHAVHHSGSGDLDRRGQGDIWTLTVAEYGAASPLEKLTYRLYRHPVVLFGIGPIWNFLITQRFVPKVVNDRQIKSIWTTNAGLLVIVVAISFVIGFRQYVLIQLPVIALAATLGVWLFYVQHQFEETYWAHHEEWDYVTAALKGSSFYRLPRLLQWFSGNIGVHHIHHLSPRIPNYKLEACHKENLVFQQAPTITLWESIMTIRFRLWDEENRRLIGFRELRQIG